MSDWLLKILHLEIELTFPLTKEQIGNSSVSIIYQCFLVFPLWNSNNTDYYTIKTFYTSKMLCLSLASKLPSHLIIPPWTPHEVKLRLQAGSWALSSLWTGPHGPNHLTAYSCSGHWVKLDTLLTPREREMVDKVTHFPTGAASYILHYIWRMLLCFKSNTAVRLHSRGSVCVSFCLRQPAWLGETHPGRSCWRGKQGSQTF